MSDMTCISNKSTRQQVLHGSHQFDDIGSVSCCIRWQQCEHGANGAQLLREALHSNVASIGVTRPMARSMATRRRV